MENLWRPKGYSDALVKEFGGGGSISTISGLQHKKMTASFTSNEYVLLTSDGCIEGSYIIQIPLSKLWWQVDMLERLWELSVLIELTDKTVSNMFFGS